MFRVCTLALLLLVSSTALAQNDPDTEVAKARFSAGRALYNAGQYQRAIDEFEAGKKLKPLPAFDYNIARCWDRLERWPEAMAAYKRYVEAEPTAPDSLEVRARIKELEERIAAMQKNSPLPRATPAPAAAPPSKRGRTVLIAGIAVGAVGLGLTAAGAAFGALSNRTADELTARDRAMDIYDSALDRQFRTERTLEVALLAVGVAAVATGVALIGVGARERNKARSATALIPVLRF